MCCNTVNMICTVLPYSPYFLLGEISDIYYFFFNSFICCFIIVVLFFIFLSFSLLLLSFLIHLLKALIWKFYQLRTAEKAN